jgi:alpha-glucosidase
MKDFIQFAGEMGWPYQLVDGGWYVGTHTGSPGPFRHHPARARGGHVRAPALSPRENKVRLWVWLYWTDADRATPTSRPLRSTRNGASPE